MAKRQRTGGGYKQALAKERNEQEAQKGGSARSALCEVIASNGDVFTGFLTIVMCITPLIMVPGSGPP